MPSLCDDLKKLKPRGVNPPFVKFLESLTKRDRNALIAKIRAKDELGRWAYSSQQIVTFLAECGYPLYNRTVVDKWRANDVTR